MTCTLYYTDSVGQRYEIEYEVHSYRNLMEFIKDQAYEDWGDCRGRAWCATCHVKISDSEKFWKIERDENARLNQLFKRLENSRLSCQIPLDEHLHLLEVIFIGDD